MREREIERVPLALPIAMSVSLYPMNSFPMEPRKNTLNMNWSITDHISDCAAEWTVRQYGAVISYVRLNRYNHLVSIKHWWYKFADGMQRFICVYYWVLPFALNYQMCLSLT